MAKSWDHLLGGYATNTLTDEEKRQLFEAALHDQALFDALADEEGLKTLLADPEARKCILASLQKTESLDQPSTSREGWRGWFRQHSSLAWAGSIAALGLALIFGWQIEKEWGSAVRQELEQAQSSSRDEVAYRAPQHPEKGKRAAREESLEKVESSTEGTNAEGQPIPESPAGIETKKIEPLGETLATAKKERDARNGEKDTPAPQVNPQVAQPQPSPSASNRQKLTRPVQPLIAEAPEVAMPDLAPPAAVPGGIIDKRREQKLALPLSEPVSAQELFYAASGSLADEVLDERQMAARADPHLRELPPEAGRASSRERAVSLPFEQEMGGEKVASTAKGIRYSFVRQTDEGKEEEVEGQQITGNWSKIRLAVESNLSGYLYVLTLLDKGKWQTLEPVPSTHVEKGANGVRIKPYKRVEFSLGQLTNALGKPVVSSLTVLLSERALDDLGQWLGQEADREGLLFERVEGAVFVVVPAQVSREIMQAQIPLGK